MIRGHIGSRNQQIRGQLLRRFSNASAIGHKILAFIRPLTGLYFRTQGCNVVSKEQFINDLKYSIKNQTGYAAGKNGTSESRWLNYQRILSGRYNKRRLRQVEVFCDHIRDEVRVRDWLHGVVVQADYKMVAIQFIEDVYLTGGWMVPDHVLWCQQNSDVIRPSKDWRFSS